MSEVLLVMMMTHQIIVSYVLCTVWHPLCDIYYMTCTVCHALLHCVSSMFMYEHHHKPYFNSMSSVFFSMCITLLFNKDEDFFRVLHVFLAALLLLLFLSLSLLVTAGCTYPWMCSEISSVFGIPDTKNIRFVFAAVKDTILQTNLKEYNLVWIPHSSLPLPAAAAAAGYSCCRCCILYMFTLLHYYYYYYYHYYHYQQAATTAHSFLLPLAVLRSTWSGICSPLIFSFS